MSSPPSTSRFSVPMPMPRPGSSSSSSHIGQQGPSPHNGPSQGQQQALSSSPRSSVDSHRRPYNAPQQQQQSQYPNHAQPNGVFGQGDRSRRTSDASFNQSPDSYGNRPGDSVGSPNSQQTHGTRYDQDARAGGRGLPRITTSRPEEEDHHQQGGPQSAPVTGPLRSHDGQHNIPARSASSPDPRAPGSEPSSPDTQGGVPTFAFPVPRPLSQYPTSSTTGQHTPTSTFPPRSSSIPDQDRISAGGSGGGPSGSNLAQSSWTAETTAASSTSPGPPARQLPPIHADLRPEDQQGSSSQASSTSSNGKRSSFQHYPEKFQAHRQESYVAQSATASGLQGGDGKEQQQPQQQQSQQRQGRSRGEPTFCGHCSQQVHGQFVRAMSKVYHLDCFRCKDCDRVVAQKFFPVEEGSQQYPLCERDYFARLDLICAKCDKALRSSYITACGEKYHIEHFTCSACDVVFGPKDSYYEHNGKVYCHYHYSTQFAVRCVGCENAILKQFVEMNRNGKDECWHPECYMISKFWNVRLASRLNTPGNSAVSSSVSLLDMTPSSLTTTLSITPGSSPGNHNLALPRESPGATSDLGPEELKAKQEAMEVKVLQIWHILSAYEESSAALISEILRAVNGGNLLDIVLLSEKFVLHVEVLFAIIDDLEAQFVTCAAKGMSHAREAKMLCRKLVNLFSVMSQLAGEDTTPTPRTQELFTLITQLAHNLKILIRIALTGAIKLDRDHGHPEAMSNALARLNLLAMDSSDPTLQKRGDYPETAQEAGADSNNEEQQQADAQDSGDVLSVSQSDDAPLRRAVDSLTRRPQGFTPSTSGIAYGFRSLAYEVTGETTLRGPRSESFLPIDGCSVCGQGLEEECCRLGMFHRYHSTCVQCQACGDTAVPMLKGEGADDGSHRSRDDASASATAILVPKSKKPMPRVNDFFYVSSADEHDVAPRDILCKIHRGASSQGGFAAVSRLEQFTFLLHVALRRLYVHYRMTQNLPSVRHQGVGELNGPSTTREAEMKRMKSVTLDRKLSSTARVPQRSTVVESPAGRFANEDGSIGSARSQAPIEANSAESNDLLQSNGTNANDPSLANSATLDVLRPAFARNNTSVLIVNENNGTDFHDAPMPVPIVPSKIQEDDAITLGDISHLAEQAINHRQPASEHAPLLSQLNPVQSLIIRHFALLLLLKTGIGHLIELDEILELLDARKGQWWNKMFKGNLVKKDQKKKGIFGVPIESLVERTGSDSQLGASNAHLRVPEFIEDIISTMRQMDMSVEGIFRKNGNIRKLQQLSEALDKDTNAVNLSEENPVQLAALLKRFLREMPDPLLTFRLHKLFCSAASMPNPEDRRRCLHLIVVMLPRYNRDTMEVLFVFLKWVASFSYRDEETGSRMDMPNLATVICPSILYARGKDPTKDESFIAIQAVEDLLINQDEYWLVPPELRFVLEENIFRIFEKELDLPPKEIHRHCLKYMQARGQSQPAHQSQYTAGGAGSGVPGQRIPNSASGIVRQTDSRMSMYRSEGNLVGTFADGSTTVGGLSASSNGSIGMQPSNSSSFRANAPPNLNSPSRPASWLKSTPGSQQSLHSLQHGPHGLVSPGSATPWRGPFQGGGNGSRNSSRGSAPGSPGPDDPERRSFQAERSERERARTPNMPQHHQQHQQQQQHSQHHHPLQHTSHLNQHQHAQ